MKAVQPVNKVTICLFALAGLFLFQNCSNFKSNSGVPAQTNLGATLPQVVPSNSPVPNASPVPSVPAKSYNILNDTGINYCGDANNNAEGLCSNDVVGGLGSFPKQDAALGRDALAKAGKLAKIGGGGKGFDYSKIANDGSVLPESAALGSGLKDWACTRDNVTGLIWEVKTSSGLHSSAHTYTWYSNGKGTESGGSCQTSGKCDTAKFVAEVNANGFCGQNDWRLPQIKELESITDFGRWPAGISLDPTYFSGETYSSVDQFWTATLPPALSNYAWYVGVMDGRVYYYPMDTPWKVRLVHGTERPAHQFSLSNQGTTVIDARTNLMWKRDYEMNTPGNPMPHIQCSPCDWYTWQDALKRAVADRTGGYDDWRLPSVRELRSLVDETKVAPALDTNYFSGSLWGGYTNGVQFWTSSPAEDFSHNTNFSWMVFGDSGHTIFVYESRTSHAYVRLVRDVTP